MGGNSVKNASDIQSDSTMSPVSPSLYKPHHSPVHCPTQDIFYTPMASPEQSPTPMDTGPSPEEQKSADGWGAPFGRAMKKIQKASYALDQMHSQLRGLLSSGNSTEGARILDSALGWEGRLIEVREDLKGGLKELGNLKKQYEELSTGKTLAGAETAYSRDTEGDRDLRDCEECTQDQSADTRVLESRRPQQEERMEMGRLRDCVYQLEADNLRLQKKINELQGEVQDLTLLQADLRIAVSVAERFREEAQEKLERCERENQRLCGMGSDSVDWAKSSTVNGSLHGYRSLPRGVILSAMREPILKSSSLMSVPPTSSPAQNSGAASSSSSSRRERRGSLETLLNESKATENLTEDSGSFFRRYGGSKRGVFLRWAQDRTCGYKHVVITNFSTSWVDGMALCALLHSYLPQMIPYSQLRPLEKRKNLQLAFHVAESVGIPPLLTPDHMLQTQGPDWQKVLLYVESIYQKFEA
ncbi:cytospin-B-like [Pseudophryne corroboree]|uniref:cytospin-B-like n=1 Tax=Pseudophryne corroboree TaxID=495146 RepID=UPI0030817070